MNADKIQIVSGDDKQMEVASEHLLKCGVFRDMFAVAQANKSPEPIKLDETEEELLFFFDILHEGDPEMKIPLTKLGRFIDLADKYQLPFYRVLVWQNIKRLSEYHSPEAFNIAATIRDLGLARDCIRLFQSPWPVQRECYHYPRQSSCGCGGTFLDPKAFDTMRRRLGSHYEGMVHAIATTFSSRESKTWGTVAEKFVFPSSVKADDSGGDEK